MDFIETLPEQPREDMRLTTCIIRKGMEVHPVVCWMPTAPDVDGVRYALRQHLGDLPEVAGITERFHRAKRVNGEVVRQQHVVFADERQRLVCVYATPRGQHG